MSWIGVRDGFASSFDVEGIGRAGFDTVSAPTPEGVLPAGAMIFEMSVPRDRDGTLVLLQYENTDRWLRRVRLRLRPDGKTTLLFQQGEMRCRAVVRLPECDRESRFRLTWNWDALAKTAAFTAENLETGAIDQSGAQAPLSMPLGDLELLTHARRLVQLAPELTMFAVADTPQPVGINPGIAAETPVETSDGARRIDRVRAGDLVRTVSGAFKPVRWVVQRDVPRAGFFAPIRLRAPYYGLSNDIRVSPDHRLMLAGTEAEYLFGENAVLLKALHLDSGGAAAREPGPGLVRYVQLLLDDHDCVNMAGLWGESLFVGDLARAPALHRSTLLADLPLSALPRHLSEARPTLAPIESVTLLSAIGS